MPRPKKCRRVCEFPQTLRFAPENPAETAQPVTLTVEEYETIRLIDKEGLSQETCGEIMQVARTTVQQIYASARKKLADVLVEGLPLRIEGGDYELCAGREGMCAGRACYKRTICQIYEKPKGENTMRVAVTYENGEIFQHFGHTAQFKVYDIQDGKILASEIVDTNGSGHGALAGLLNVMKVDALICGGIGGGAQMALVEAGIKLYGGVSGSADAAAQALAEGKLDYNPAVRCDHHDHHGEGHTCGSHGCGSHTCG